MRAWERGNWPAASGRSAVRRTPRACRASPPERRAAELCAAVTQVVLDLGEISWTIFGTPMHFTPQSTARFSAAKHVIDSACLDMVARRKATAPACRPRDLLTLLVESDSTDE